MGHFFLYHTPYCSPHTALPTARLPNTATSASPLSTPNTQIPKLLPKYNRKYTKKQHKTQIVLYIPANACIMDSIVVKQLNNFK
jgi:hypothetical protein